MLSAALPRDEIDRGTYRAGGRALGRFGVLAAAVQPVAGSPRRVAPADHRDGACAEGVGADECAIRDSKKRAERYYFRAGSEPARLAHGTVRVESHGAAAGQNRGALHDRHDARRTEHCRRSRAAVLLGQGSGVPVHQVSGRGHHTRAGDEIHRRSDGRGHELRRGFCEIAARGGRPFAGVRQGFCQCARRRQAGSSRDCTRSCCVGVSTGRNARYCGGAGCRGSGGDVCQ